MAEADSASHGLLVLGCKLYADVYLYKEGEDVSVELDVERRQIVITRIPAEAEGVDVEYARQVGEFIDAYRPALVSLAAR